MVKPAATNMTITLQQSGGDNAAVKPLVIGEQTVVQTNRSRKPILPHQPVATEQDRAPSPEQSPAVKPAHPLDHFKNALSLERIAGLSLNRLSGEVKLRDFADGQIDLFYRRYNITKDTDT